MPNVIAAHRRPRLTTALGAALLLAAGGCSVMEPDKIDYKSASRGSSLEVPPDLTQLAAQSHYQMPGGPVTASSYQAGQKAMDAAGAPIALNAIGDVHFERRGDERWLHVDRPADKIWPQVRDFWQDNGFVLALDQPSLGLMETDWAETRAKIPADFIRSAIGKMLDSLYSTGQRDRFRTRVERGEQGGADIYITHNGMEEVYTSTTRESTVWQPRARDPELEIEFLRRLMVKLGVSEEQSRAMTASGANAASGGAAAAGSRTVSLPGGAQAVQITDDFDRAWRRVGLALDRTGFTVEDRDRSKGIYFVRYVDPTAQKKEPGFFGKLFGAASQPLPTAKYQITVHTEGQATTVSVLADNGAPAPEADAKRIVKVLADELK
jgi:outer membrane protein assembly factor BamC